MPPDTHIPTQRPAPRAVELQLGAIGPRGRAVIGSIAWHDDLHRFVPICNARDCTDVLTARTDGEQVAQERRAHYLARHLPRSRKGST